MSAATVTCHTEQCPAAGRPILADVTYVSAGEDRWVDAVVCGACGQFVTDVIPPLPPAGAPETEPDPAG